MDNAFSFKLDSDGIGQLIFDLPGEKINKFSQEILKQLENIIDEISSRKEIKALIISSAKEGIFIAGADVNEFKNLTPTVAETMIENGHRVFSKISKLPFPTIAYINGACFGGGTELALACTFRVVSDSPKTTIGLPEVSLGIIPGWGGTQRLPRLVGLSEGLSMILSAKPIKAQKAYKIHLADAIVAPEFDLIKVPEFVTYILTSKGRQKILDRRKPKGAFNFLIEGNPLGRQFLFHKARKDLLDKTKGHYPAPIVALNVVKETYTLPLDEGLAKEREYFLKAITNNDFRYMPNLVQIFFTSEALKKNAGIPETAKPMKVNSAGVLGAGTMGAGISWLFCNKDIPVRMKDINWEAVAKGYASIHDINKKLIKIKKLKPNEANLKFHHVSGTIDYSGYKQLDLIIEAATENLELKHRIFEELEKVVKPDAVIASNTSSLTIAEMSKGMKHPERFLGMHFFNPANRMPLVEVVPGKATTPEALATAIDICRKLGKTPIVVGDCPGFLVNRVFVLGANETMWLFQEGVDGNRIEKVMLDFGMPMSPFVLSDEVGLDVSYHVGETFMAAYGDRMQPPEIVKKLYDQKLFGKKVGKGFYIYKGKEKKFNTEVLKFVSNKNSKDISDQDIIDRMVFLMINEASRCLEEGIVSKPEYLDMAMIMGTGFPPFRGGLLMYADERGIANVVEGLERFEKDYGERFKPSQKLLDMAKNNQSFYGVKQANVAEVLEKKIKRRDAENLMTT